MELVITLCSLHYLGYIKLEHTKDYSHYIVCYRFLSALLYVGASDLPFVTQGNGRFPSKLALVTKL